MPKRILQISRTMAGLYDQYSPISLEPSDPVFPPTYISIASKTVLHLVSHDTKNVQHYEWRQCASNEEENDILQNTDILDPEQRQKIQSNHLFNSDSLRITPLSGSIWPSGKEAIFAEFRPQKPGIQRVTAYLYNIETQRRIPYTFECQGIPATAQFNISQINLGHISLDNRYEYKIILTNTGEIPLDFKLFDYQIQSHLKIELTPEKGHLNVGDSCDIYILVDANHVGQFNETFQYKILSSIYGQTSYEDNQYDDFQTSPMPSITIYGKVIGPTFDISQTKIDFGTVSYGFSYVQKFEIRNKSEIPLDYNLNLVPDKSFELREFKISPNCGTVAKFSTQTIEVNFLPISVKKYSVRLNMDSDKFEEKLYSMVITANCFCPEISIKEPMIDLGALFKDYKYTSTIKLLNNTKYPAKYEYIDDDDQGVVEAKIDLGKFSGVIAANGISEIPIYITPNQLGFLKVSRYIRIFGNENDPLMFTINCLCTGPNIKMSVQEKENKVVEINDDDEEPSKKSPSKSKKSTKKESQNSTTKETNEEVKTGKVDVVDFGLIKVLQEHENILDIFNDSLISAPFTCRLENSPKSPNAFSISMTEGEIQPGETLHFPIKANLIDILTYKAKLTFSFKLLSPITVNVTAKGKGSAIVSSINMELIDMQYLFTGSSIYKQFQLKNFSKREQEVKWQNTQLVKPTIEQTTSEIAHFSYSIEPEDLVIKPGELVNYTIRFDSNNPCKFEFSPQCDVMVEKHKLLLFKPLIKGEFVKPAIEFNQNQVVFQYIHDIQKEEQISASMTSRNVISPSLGLLQPISIENSVRNLSRLPLEISAFVDEPFVLSQSEFLLNEQETETFEITFDPRFKKDFTSQTIDTKIVFSLAGIAQEFFINVRALMIFPNLQMTPASINFNSLLQNTEDTKTVKLTNTSKIPVSYRWELLPSKKEQEELLNNNANEIGKVFDIFPISGQLAIGESTETHVNFCALAIQHGEPHHEARAICHVFGGPDYTLDLQGSACNVNYQLTPKLIDFGTCYFAERLSSSFTLENTSDIPLLYQIKIPKACHFSEISIEPSNGTIEAREIQNFTIKVVPGFPQKIFHESFFVQIGKVDETELTIRVNCAFPQIKSNLPRYSDEDSASLIVSKEIDSLNSEEQNDDKEIEKRQSMKRQSMIKKMDQLISKAEVSLYTDHIRELQKNPSKFKTYLKRLTTNPNKNTSYDGFILSKYLVDFGKITFGETKSVEYTIQSISEYPISFYIQTKNIEGTGFQIEPTEFTDVEQNSEITIQISFNASQRTISAVGEEIYQIPIVFQSDLASMLVLKIFTMMPKISLNKDQFQFETTFLGQSRTKSFQVSNPLSIPIEFTIGEPISNENTPVENKPKKRNQKVITDADSFSCSPKTGMLPPASFQNIEMKFSPIKAKEYSVTIPIYVRHSNDVSSLTVTGTGYDLKVVFNKSVLSFGHVQPFEINEDALTNAFNQYGEDNIGNFTGYPTAEIEMTNPTDYPITVFSPQFDLDILNKQLKYQFDQETEKDGTRIPLEVLKSLEFNQTKGGTGGQSSLAAKPKNQHNQTTQLQAAPVMPAYVHPQPLKDTFSKFSMCVIVNGPPLSGKTTVSKFISHFLGDIPIISLKELWKNLLVDPATSDSDSLINAFKEKTSSPEYLRGFVIDGLDAFPEPTETETMIQNVLKNKKVIDELTKNPLTIVPLSLPETQASADKKSGKGSTNTNPTSNGDQTQIEKTLSMVLSGLSGQYVFQIALSAKEESINKHMQVSQEENEKKKQSEDKEEMDQIMEMDEETYSKLTDEEREQIDKKRSEYRNKIITENGGDLDYLNPPSPDPKTLGSTKQSARGSRRTERSRLSTASKAKPKPIPQKPSPKKLPPKKGGIFSDPVQSGMIMFNFTIGKLTYILLNNDQNSSFHFQAIDSELIKGKKGENVIQHVNSLLVDTTFDIETIENQIKEFLPDLDEMKEKLLTEFMPKEEVMIPDFFAENEAPHLYQQPAHFRFVTFEKPGDFIKLERYATPQPQQQQLQKTMTNKKGKIIVDDALTQDLDIYNYTKRWTLEPKQTEKLTIQFLATDVGTFEDTIMFCIDNYKNEVFSFQTKGISLYPDVDRDPHTIFNGYNFIESLNNKSRKIESNVYLEDTQEFYIGPLVVAAKDKGKKDTYLYKHTLYIKNNSPFDVEITPIIYQTSSASLQERQNFSSSMTTDKRNSRKIDQSDNPNIWGIEISKNTIPAKETGEFQICLHPTNANTYFCTLQIFVKDNPEPFYLKFRAESFIPQVEIATNQLDFGKQLINQEKTLEIPLKNPLKIPVVWRLKNPQQLNGFLTFNEVEGVIKPLSNSMLKATLLSAKPTTIKKQIQMEILDSQKTKNFQIHQINIMSEVFDLPFEFAYPKGMDHLDFGVLKIGQMKPLVCTLKNKGKYPSSFHISYVKPQYEKFLTMSESNGILQPNDKLLNINFIFTSKNKILKYQNEKFLVITFSEPETNTEVGTFNIFLTGTALYSEYLIDCKSSIDFGCLSIGETSSKELKITNKGQFPFDYEIVAKPIEIAEPEKAGKGAPRKKSQRGVSRQGANNEIQTPMKRSKAKTKELQVGNFFISPLPSGSISPGNSTTLKIDFYDTEARTNETVILLRVSDVSPKDPAHFKFETRSKENRSRNSKMSGKSNNKNQNAAEIDTSNMGRPITLIGQTFVPGIDTKNTEKIFPGQNLCLRYDLKKHDTTSFLEDEQLFHFSPRILNTETKVDISLKNKYPVPCIVDATVKPLKSPAKKHKNEVDSMFPFELSAVSIAIPPLDESSLTLTFNPKVEGEFSGMLEATVRGSTDPDARLLKFGVEGIGALPSVKFADDYGDLISFGKTLINTRKERIFMLVNDGYIPARVKFSVVQQNTNETDPNEEDGILTEPVSSRSMYPPEFHLENVDLVREVEIDPQKSISFNVAFSPYEIKKVSFSLLISVINNEKSNLNLNFVGEGFKTDIVFEQIPGDDNQLVFNDMIVSRSATKTFVMHNLCQDDARFEWDEHPDLTFTPRIGHLKHGNRKKITVTFQRDEPIQYTDQEIHCKWSKIKLDDDRSIFDWDDSMKEVNFIPASQLISQIQQAQMMQNDKKSARLSNNRTQRESNLPSLKLQGLDFESLNMTSGELTNLINGANNNSTFNPKSRTLVSARKFPPKKPQPPNRSNIQSRESVSTRNAPSPRRKNRPSKLDKSHANVLNMLNSMSSVSTTESNGSSFLPPLNSNNNDNDNLVKITITKPEPMYQVIENCKDLILYVSAICDYIKYEIISPESKEITFAPTMMYDTRISTVEIQNTSSIKFDYSWVMNKYSALRGGPEYEISHKSPFSVMPASGFINAGEMKTFQVRFSPEEVDDFSSYLWMDITYLNQQQQHQQMLVQEKPVKEQAEAMQLIQDYPEIYVSGYSQRPLCHFDVDLSDYISAGRRHPDYNYPLPEDIRVIELFSSGIGKESSKRMQVINATVDPYEIKWDCIQEHSSPTIACDSSRALVSSGKRYSIMFSYKPTSLKTVESLWEFSIPDHNVVVPFLIVGRIMPK